MRSRTPHLQSAVRRAALTLALTLAGGATVAAPSSAAPLSEPAATVETLPDAAFADLWSRWLELWEPVEALLTGGPHLGVGQVYDGSSYTSDDGGDGSSGDSTEPDPGSGGGYVDPNG